MRRPRSSKLRSEAGADPVAARKAAMDFLARREHSEQELARKLAARGYADDTVAETLADLVADRLVSNTRFAETFVHARMQRGSGPQKIRAELRARGISEALIENCLEAHADHWRDLARQVREKRFGSTRPVDFRERSRQMRFLQQRGFGSEHIRSVFGDVDEEV